MANAEDNSHSLHLYMECLLATCGPEANLRVFLLKAQMMLTAKNPILSKLLNSTHSITTQQIPHQREEEEDN